MFHLDRVFVGVIKMRSEMRSDWIEADPKSNEGVLIGDRKGHGEAQRRRRCEDGNGVMCPQAKGCQ